MNLHPERLEPVDSLSRIAAEVANCQNCSLYHSRKEVVPGEGPQNAALMFVGEAPGFYENESGRPFVGAAGRYLEELLGGIGLKREEVFITNIVKCRPPGNRDPEPAELKACQDYLERQIKLLQPRMIITLGRFSMAYFLPEATIGQAHGQVRLVDGRLVVPMYHPAAALHQGSLKPVLQNDFKRLVEYIKDMDQIIQSLEDSSDQSESKKAGEGKQLTLF